MKNCIVLLLLSISISCIAKGTDLRTAEYVDVSKYIGKWYAVSALPQFFTRKCLAQTAEYEIINEQTISVLNTCLKSHKKVTTINGQAVVTNAASNAELEVTFNNFFTRLFRVKGDYNIIKLDADYKYVLVGSRDRKSLWILSRTETMPKADYDEYVEEAKLQKFDTSKLILSKF